MLDVDMSRMLDKFTLASGGHLTRTDGMCAMEMVAFLAGEIHSYHPQCACPALTSFTISLNDALDDIWRQSLKVFLPRIIGTRDGLYDERAKFLVTKSCLTFLPMALEKSTSKQRRAVAIQLSQTKDISVPELRRMLEPISDPYNIEGELLEEVEPELFQNLIAEALASVRDINISDSTFAAGRMANVAARIFRSWEDVAPAAFKILDEAISIGEPERMAKRQLETT